MSQNLKKEAVGKGLKSLLQNIDADIKRNTSVHQYTPNAQPVGNVGIQRISLEKIQINPDQPRKDFDEMALQELAASIKLHDIIQPITVKKLTHDTYQIISGERRFKASQIAQLKDIPVYVRAVTGTQNNIELALLENLQRTDLNAIEIALSYQQLIEEHQMTHENLAERMSTTRSTITNHLRLLKLPPSIQIAVRNGSISMGHARAVSGLEKIEDQLFAFNRIIEKQLSVRATEDLVKDMANTPLSKQHEQEADGNNNHIVSISPVYKKIEDAFVHFFNSKVELKHNDKKKKGTITIHYFNNDELTEMMKKIGITLN